MEESSVEATRLQFAHRAIITVRQDCLRTIGRRGDGREPRRDGVERLVPTDRLESPAPFRPDPFFGDHQSVRAVNAVEIARHLLAKKPPSERMLSIAPE